MVRTSETRANEAKIREQANRHPRASVEAERLINAADELRVIAERRERNGWPR